MDDFKQKILIGRVAVEYSFVDVSKYLTYSETRFTNGSKLLLIREGSTTQAITKEGLQDLSISSDESGILQSLGRVLEETQLNYLGDAIVKPVNLNNSAFYLIGIRIQNRNLNLLCYLLFPVGDIEEERKYVDNNITLVKEHANQQTFNGSRFTIEMIKVLCIVMASSCIAMIVYYKITRPLTLLGGSMKYATKLDLDNMELYTTHSSRRKKTHIREIDEMNAEFDKIVKALRSFRKYIPQYQVKYLLESNIEALLGVVEKDLTILFLDIANFTTITESLNPETLVQFYAIVMGTLSDVVESNSGTVDKFIGDALMCFWNAPKFVYDHEELACLSAYNIIEELPNINHQLKDKGWNINLGVRIGISSGKCWVGNLGSQSRMNYTCIGSEVSVASSLESINKLYGTQICISNSVYEEVQDTMVCFPIDQIEFKGKKGALVVYNLLGPEYAIDASLCLAATKFDRAFSFYLNNDFDLAIDLYTELRPILPKVCDLMMKHCTERPKSKLHILL